MRAAIFSARTPRSLATPSPGKLGRKTILTLRLALGENHLRLQKLLISQNYLSKLLIEIKGGILIHSFETGKSALL